MLHGKALRAVSRDDRATKEVDDLMREVNDDMDAIRGALGTLSNETNRMRGNEVQARKAQQSIQAKRMLNVAKKFEDLQENYKNKYKQQIAKELKSARPEWSDQEIKNAVQHGGKVFQQAILGGNIKDQRNALSGILIINLSGSKQAPGN